MKNKTYIWGTGRNSEELNKNIPTVIEQLGITGYIDNNPQVIGTVFWGKMVYAPSVLTEQNVCKTVIVSNRFEKEIKNQIENEYSEDNVKVLDGKEYIRIQLIQRYKNSDDKDILEIINFLKNHNLDIFNYSFTNKYNKIQPEIIWDDVAGMYFTIYKGRRMYFSRKLNCPEIVKTYYRSILIEQDEESPHRYYCRNCYVRSGDVVIDAGVAEGNFSLSIIDMASKIYMFEPDPDWIDALKLTFKDYKDKVIIIPKGISDKEGLGITTIDKSINEKIDFIKMDIEGEEYYALKGAENIIRRSETLRLAIASYHQELAYDLLRYYLQSINGFDCSHSKGYMWYPDSRFREQSLRRGILFAHK